MMGGNPRNGWIHKTQDGGYFDLVEFKRTFKPNPLDLWFERILEQLEGCLNNRTSKSTNIGERESDTDFRGSYV